jgi:RNA polymerase sigma-70 factor (ECF subfamily)
LRQSCRSDPRSDSELIRVANGGDAAAFDALYYRYRDWILGLAYRWTGSHDDTLDVLQETFAYLLSKMPGLRLTSRMTTFLYPVVKNLCLRSRAKRRLVSVRDADLTEVPDPHPPGDNDNLMKSDLTLIMKRLPEEQREVILLRFVDGLRLEEIAELLRIPVGTAKSRLHYAIAALRKDPRIRHYFLH